MVLDLQKTKAREKRLLQQKAAIESRLTRAQKALREAERKADSRRKIILGGVFKKAVTQGLISEFSAREMIGQLASDRDKKALADFDFGTGETAVSEPPAVTDSTDEFEPFEPRE